MDPVSEQEYTEAELTGENDAPAPKTPPEPPGKDAVTPTTGEPPASPTPPEPPTPVPAKEHPPKDTTVPLAALHEERERRKELQRRLEELEKRIAAVPPKKDPVTLISEDPEAAMAAAMNEIDDLRTEIARSIMEREIRSEVPDFFEKAAAMEELLLGEGFDEEEIKGIVGASGKKAPKLFKILSRIIDQPDAKKLRETVIAELTPQITATVTAQVTKELMAKFKITETPTNLDKVPGSAATGKIVADTEEDFAKLTPKEQEAFLSGEA